MRKKKLFISIAAGILAATSISTLTIDGYQAHAAQTTNQDENNEQGTLVLNHKTRVYNKKGKKYIHILKPKACYKKAAQFSMLARFKRQLMQWLNVIHFMILTGIGFIYLM